MRKNPTDPRARFGQYFQEYFQRSTLASLEELGDVMANHGVVLDYSTYSHWRCGTRMPRSRHILLILLKMLVEYQGLTTSQEANEFLSAAQLGNLSPLEEAKVFAAESKRRTNGPVYLSSVHLVLPVNLLTKIDALALEQGISRTTMINSILEERLL